MVNTNFIGIRNKIDELRQSIPFTELKDITQLFTEIADILELILNETI